MNITSNYQGDLNNGWPEDGTVLLRDGLLSATAMALLVGVDVDDIKNVGRNGSVFPMAWVESGNRRRAEALLVMSGHEDMEDALRLLLGVDDDLLPLLQGLAYWAESDYGMVLEFDPATREWCLAERTDDD